MRNYLAQVLALDLRSLALFRIAMGWLIIIDTIMRMGDLTAHYSDNGVLPRHALTDSSLHLTSDFGISIYMIAGSPLLMASLMLIQIVVAGFLIIGFKTRMVTFICWIFIISLHSRNPMIITGGDSLLSLLLLWSVFLPLGARFSVDKALNRGQYDGIGSVSNLGSAGIILQIVCVYLFNWWNKLDPVWIVDHTALYYTLNADLFTTHLGKLLATFVPLTQLMTMGVHMFQLIGPVLLFLPFWNQSFRIIVICGFVMFHLGIALTLNIGYFPYVSIVSWLILIPAAPWQWLENRRLRKREPFIMYYDGGCDFCIKTVLMFKTFLCLDFAPIKEVQSDPQINTIFSDNNTWVIRRHNKGLLTKWDAVIYAISQSFYLSWFAKVLEIKPLKTAGDRLYVYISNHRSNYSKFTSMLKYNDFNTHLGLLSKWVIAGLMILVLFWNFSNVDQFSIERPSLVKDLGSATRINQKWSMFAPHPVRADGWIVAPGKLTDGTTVDVRSGNPVSWIKPRHVAPTYENNRWRKYLINIKKDSQYEQRVYYGKYICREWFGGKGKRGESLERFDLYFMLEHTQPPGEAPLTEKQLMWSHDCFPD